MIRTRIQQHNIGCLNGTSLVHAAPEHVADRFKADCDYFMSLEILKGLNFRTYYGVKLSDEEHSTQQFETYAMQCILVETTNVSASQQLSSSLSSSSQPSLEV